MKNFILVFLFCSLIILSGTNTAFKPSSYKVKKIVIDAGHGGKDPGCLGKSNREALIALDVALELGQLINSQLPEVKVLYTRKSNTFVDLHERAAIANRNNADLFISIHCNSGNPSTFGSETYTMGLHSSEGNLDVAKRENSVILQEDNYQKKYEGFDPGSPMAHIMLANFQTAFMENSLRFADKVETKFKNGLKRKSRGVKQAGFLVLWKTSMPSALIEIGYLTNVSDEKFLSEKPTQKEIANGIFLAFTEYKKEIEATP